MDGFLPQVQAWFATACGSPSPAQAAGWPAIRGGGHVLIAAPTGTGKTLAAFLVAIDGLLRNEPGEQCLVLYVSPLKALSNDVRKNLLRPLEAIAHEDPFLPRVRVEVRTGDTTSSERARMQRRPPHILVTTPESLAVLLTSAGGRGMLAGIRTVIVDEIHALAGTKRGAHLALSLERLQALRGGPDFQRIGLSATAKPLADVAHYLAGVDRTCHIVDCTQPRPADLGVEIPQSPLEAVCSHETWGEVYTRLVELVGAHRTTLIFVNTRKMAERLALRLVERLDQATVACHHGSMSKERRLDAETRLKEGSLRCLVATATLELGIDIGDVDLVVQIGSPHALHTFLQRLGRAGHGPARTPKARLFALTSDELVEAAALLMALSGGDLDRLTQVERPWDVLAQQAVAAAAESTWSEHDLHRMLCRAWPYRAVDRAQFSRVVAMHAQGRHALLHRDEVAGTVRGSKRARLTALLNAGAIPDAALFQVREDGSDLLIGTLDEDFAMESTPGEIFQLGNTAWRIARVESRTGVVRVTDARGAAPTIPFWLGEAPGRTRELSTAVGRLRRLADGPAWLAEHCRLSPAAAAACWEYLAAARIALGRLPTDTTVVAERFFDEEGGQHLVIHAPVGTRILRGWGLALRKRFCAGFGFELEAAANDESLILSLGPTSASFPLDEVFAFLAPATLRKTLITACLTGGRFQTMWRQTAQIALLIERASTGGKVQPFLQRIRAADALAQAFPMANACPDNVSPDRIEIPEDHPIVTQTIDDLLLGQMDYVGLVEVLDGLRSGAIAVHAVDTAEPSPLAQSILAARPYAFLDDTPFEERRTRAVARSDAQRPPERPGDLDPAVADEVRGEVFPDPRSQEDLHQTLQWCGWLTDAEIDAASWRPWLDALVATGRAVRGPEGWMAVVSSRPSDADLLAGRMEIAGPITCTVLRDVDARALELETRGLLMRITVGGQPHWCLKRLVQRIQRRMLDRRRGAWQAPASIEEFLRFLARWQGVTGERRQGRDGLAQVIQQLSGLELPAGAWDGLVLPARVSDLKPEWISEMTLSGTCAWGRLWTAGAEAGPGSAGEIIRTTPISFVPREDLARWLAISGPAATSGLSSYGRAVLDCLTVGGALFTADLQTRAGLLNDHLERGLGECIAAGLVSADSFAALRWLLLPSERRGRARLPVGRWCIFRPAAAAATPAESRPPASEEDAELVACTLLKRTGVAVRRLFDRERIAMSWRDIHRALRRMELRGDCLGGRFVAGLGGEQFALPAAAEQLRRIRGEPPAPSIECSAADPLNYTGILGDGPRVRAVMQERIRVA